PSTAPPPRRSMQHSPSSPGAATGEAIPWPESSTNPGTRSGDSATLWSPTPTATRSTSSPPSTPNCYPTAAQQPGARLLSRRRVVLGGDEITERTPGLASSDERALVPPQVSSIGVPDFGRCRGARASRIDEVSCGLPAQDLRQVLGSVAEPLCAQPAQLPR